MGYIDTLDYGKIRIGTREELLRDGAIGLVEMCDGSYFELRVTCEGEMVAIKHIL